MNVIIIIAVIFLTLFVLTKVLEGRAEPLTAEKANKLSRIAMFLIAALLIVQAIRYLF